MGLVVNLYTKTLDAFLTDGNIYNSNRNNEGSTPSPHVWDTLYLGTHAYSMLLTLADALVSIQQARLTVTVAGKVHFIGSINL